MLSEGAAAGAVSNRENVPSTLKSLKPKLTADDTLLVILFGHGTFDGTAAKFNLVGPDMDSSEWKAALDGSPACLVFVNTTSSSFPFVQALAGKNRIVIAATDSAAQKYATVFPQYFIEALQDRDKADNDKNGRLSVWEAFTYAGQAVKQSFDQKQTLVTERSVIEDGTNGVLGQDHVSRFRLPPTHRRIRPSPASRSAALRSKPRSSSSRHAKETCPPGSTKKSSNGLPSSSPRLLPRFDRQSKSSPQRAQSTQSC